MNTGAFIAAAVAAKAAQYQAGNAQPTTAAFSKPLIETFSADQLRSIAEVSHVQPLRTTAPTPAVEPVYLTHDQYRDLAAISSPAPGDPPGWIIDPRIRTGERIVNAVIDIGPGPGPYVSHGSGVRWHGASTAQQWPGLTNI